MNNLKTLAVVGGGTAGFVAALILKSRFPDLTINLIRSKKIGIIGVGEGSTEHFAEFMKRVGIDWKTIITECDATFKSGIMFKGWNTEDFLHSLSADKRPTIGQYSFLYGKIISENLPNRMMNSHYAWENQIYAHNINLDNSPFNQYHFNTNKLNDFLTKIAISKDIKIIDDEILDVTLTDDGSINSLIGELGTYNADFYIDSTGFRKILISKLGAKWQSYKEYLKMKSAIVFPLGDTEEYNLWTLSKAIDYGWMFKIPVWGRSGNGYIYDSDYITVDQATTVVEKLLGHDDVIGKHLSFDPGALDRVWIKNCCAIGLSASFVEPLEASSIGTSIQQTFLLMHRLPNYTENTIKKYNKDVNDILLNIRDYILLHYITKKDNTQFWIDAANITLPDSLQEKLELWKYNLPIEDDFQGITQYALFKTGNFIQLLYGLKLFDIEKIKEEYNAVQTSLRTMADFRVDEILNYEKNTLKFGHKKFIQLCRQNKLLL
jgi:tryptophan halogenase